MSKLGISLSDDLAQKLESAAHDKGKTVSGMIADVLTAYFSADGKETPPPPANPPAKVPDPPQVPASQTSIVDLQSLLSRIRELDAKVSENSSVTNENTKTIGELDERLCKLWHQVNDK